MSYIEDSEDLLGDALNINIPDEDDPIEHIENENNDNDENKEDNDENGVPRKVEPPKKRTIRNPQPRLNPQRISGPRGVHTIENYFVDFKFQGKGHEATDLNRIMRRLEHWAHRLFPKYRFDDCLEKIEKLGNKRTVQNYMNQYRHGTLQLATNGDDDDKPVENMEDIEELAQPLDELDSYLGEQIAKAKTAQNTTINSDAAFDALIATPSSRMADSPMTSSTPFISKRTNPIAKPTTTLTDEQKERMALNKKLAVERLLQKKKEMAAAAAVIAQESTESIVVPETESQNMVTEDEMLDMLNKQNTT